MTLLLDYEVTVLLWFCVPHFVVLPLQGFVPGLVGTSHAALQFMTYEGLKREQNKYKKMPSDSLLVRK